MIERILTVRYRFYAEDGSYVEAVVDGEAMDSGDKSSNKCMAIAHKYALLQVFCIPTENDNDPDAHTPEARDPEKPRRRATTMKSEPAQEPALTSEAKESYAAAVDAVKRINIVERAKEVLLPLVPGSPRYLWAMEELFHTRDWEVVKGFSLKKLDADTRGRITQIIEQAKDTPEETLAKISEKHPVEASLHRAPAIASIRKQIERIPEGPAREKAMENAWGKPDWAELESFSTKEILELIEAGHVARIVKDALKAEEAK